VAGLVHTRGKRAPKVLARRGDWVAKPEWEGETPTKKVEAEDGNLRDRGEEPRNIKAKGGMSSGVG